MPTGTIEKLRPDGDLQCFFYHPSAIAALSETSANGFTVSGSWRQQFDWAVVEWNRDNVYEHPLFRNLPDGDLSGLTLTYEETRINCIPFDSTLYPTVDWPYLRVWAGPNGAEDIYFVKLNSPQHATPVEGSYQCAYADLTLGGTAQGGDYIGIACLDEHHTYQLYGTDTLESAVQAVRESINAFSTVMKATSSGTTLRLYYTGGQSIAESQEGANGNRFGVYSYVSGSNSMSWSSPWSTFSNGTSPTKWRVSLDFGSLVDREGRSVPTSQIRKLRWTYAADFQAGAFERSEFCVRVSEWTVEGTGRSYSVAGPGSQRFEDDTERVAYSGTWTREQGNYSGGSMRRTVIPESSVAYTYRATGQHALYLGTRSTPNAATISITVDGQAMGSVHLQLPGEDYLWRHAVGSFGSGTHTVVVTHSGAAQEEFIFDYFEAAIPTAALPTFAGLSNFTLATDWDTDHCLAIAPERTARLIDALGFRGRANHYMGALWFYELLRQGHCYASATVVFEGTPSPNSSVAITLGRTGQPASTNTVLTKLIHVGDTPSTLATVFALEINRGYTGIRASASGGTLTIYSRSMGADGNDITLAASTTTGGLTVTASGSSLSGGTDGQWITDLIATPRVNRAARDWNRSFFATLHDLGIEVTAAFSMELQHADSSAGAGVAQRGPSGDAILLPTPAVQTNFSPPSLEFWKQVYSDAADLQAAAGLAPYLQFGEVQWWYFPSDGLGTNFSGMPFYDAWTQGQFHSLYGRPLPQFPTNTANPSAFIEECSFLSSLVGSFTTAIMAHVRSLHPSCRFEVLYPTDVNQTAFNKVINYPQASWTPEVLSTLKTESFGFTLGRDLDKAESTMRYGSEIGFPATQRAHLVGIGDATAPWLKEVRSAAGKGFESIVLFALDHFCLIGYDLPMGEGLRRSTQFEI